MFVAKRAMFKLAQFAKTFLLGLTLFGFASGHAQQSTAAESASDACLALKKGLSLGVTLSRVKAAFQKNQTLNVVAFGSSSTTGFGTFRSNAAFPDVMKHELLRLRPSARIELTNSGRLMDNISDNIARLDHDVLRHKPDLVVWQLGTNDAVWRGIPDNAKEMVGGAVGRLKAANVDVILMDLQYAPVVNAATRHVRMEEIIAGVAREQNVGLFPRFVLMKRAADAGVKGLVWWDGLHNSVEGHKCIGIALAQMIDAAAR